MFWTNVKSLLKDKNLSQSDLCKITGKSLASFQQQVHHGRVPVADEALEIAKALDTTVEFLLTGKEPEIKDRSSEVIEAVEKALQQFK